MLRLRRCFAEDFDLTLEASAERTKAKDFLEDKVGKGYFDKYLKVRDRLKDADYKDFNKLIKQDPEEVKIVIDRANGDEPHIAVSADGVIGENEDFIVYRVTNFDKSKELGVNTRWCITGRYGTMDRDDNSYFYSYLDNHNLDGGYYFYLSKHDPYEKYCVLLKRNGSVDSIWKAPNGQISADTLSKRNFPDIKGIDLSDYDYPHDDPDGDPAFTEEEEENGGFSLTSLYEAIVHDNSSELERQLDYMFNRDEDVIDNDTGEVIDLNKLFTMAIDNKSYSCAEYLAEKDYELNSDSRSLEIDIDKYINGRNWKAVDILLTKTYDLEDIAYNSFEDFLKKATEEEFKEFVLFSKNSDSIDLEKIVTDYPDEDSNLLVYYLDKISDLYHSNPWKIDNSVLDILLDSIDISDDSTLCKAVKLETDIDVIKKLLQHNADINYSDYNDETALDCAMNSFYEYYDNPTKDVGEVRRNNLKKIIKTLYQLHAEMNNYEESDIEDVLGKSAEEREEEENIEYIIKSITNMEKKQKSEDDLKKFIHGLDKDEYNKARMQLLQTLHNEEYLYTLLQGMEDVQIEKPICLEAIIAQNNGKIGEITEYILKKGLSEKVLLPLSLVSRILGSYSLNRRFPEIGKLVFDNLGYYGKLIEEERVESSSELANSISSFIYRDVVEDGNFKHLEEVCKLNKDMADIFIWFFFYSLLDLGRVQIARKLLDEAKSLGILDLYKKENGLSIFDILIKALAKSFKPSQEKGNKDIEDLVSYALKSDMDRSEIERAIDSYKSYYDDDTVEDRKKMRKYMINFLSSLINLPIIESRTSYFYL